MKKLFLLAGLAMSLFITSCKKDNDNNPGGGNGGNNGKLLKQVTSTEGGVVTVSNLTYDANKRLTNIKSTDNKKIANFTYDANGNLTKIEQVEEDFKLLFTFTYQNGVPVSGVLKNWEIENGVEELTQHEEVTYTVANNQVTKMKSIMKLNGDLEVEYNFTYQNGQIHTVESTGDFEYKAVFAFGTKKPAMPSITKFILDQGGFSAQFGSKNEMLSITYDFPGTEQDFIITNTYTYDANGYVLTSTNGTTQNTYTYQ